MSISMFNWGRTRRGPVQRTAWVAALALAAAAFGVGASAGADNTVLSWPDPQVREIAFPIEDPAILGVASGVSENLVLVGRGQDATTGSIWAWAKGQQPRQVLKKVTMQPLEGIRAVAAGQDHFLALGDDGKVWAWGNASCGQLGPSTSEELANGDTSRYFPTRHREEHAVEVVGLREIEQIAAGSTHNLALDSGGILWAWGNNSKGQLGHEVNQHQHASLWNTVVGFSGQFYCEEPPVSPEQEEAYEGIRQLFPTPVPIPRNLPIFSIAAGTDFSMALTTDGSVWTWGGNCYGQLGSPQGNLPLFQRATPLPVGGLPQSASEYVVAIAGGGDVERRNDHAHSLALTSTGRVFSWGWFDLAGGDRTFTGGFGEDVASPCWMSTKNPATGRGLSPVEDRVTNFPVLAKNLTDVSAIAGGKDFSLAVDTSGRLFGWGKNESGQLGESALGDSVLTPVEILKTALSGRPLHSISSRDRSQAVPGTPPSRPAYTFVGPADLPPEVTEAVDDAEGTLTGALEEARRKQEELEEDVDELADEDQAIGDALDLAEEAGKPAENPDQKAVDALEDVDDAAHVASPGGPGPAPGQGAVFVTGHPADVMAGGFPNQPASAQENTVRNAHPCVGRGACPGGPNFVRRAVGYVTGSPSPRLLLVIGGDTNEFDPRGQQLPEGNNLYSASPRGMEESGFARCPESGAAPPGGCFDIAFRFDVFGSSSHKAYYKTHYDDPGPNPPYPAPGAHIPPPVSLQDVPISVDHYDAVVVGSGQPDAHSEILASRRQEIYDFVNSGGGLVSFTEFCRQGRPYLPFLSPYALKNGPSGDSGDPNLQCQNGEDGGAHAAPSSGFVVTPEGQAIGLLPTDPNLGMGGQQWFPCSIGAVFDRYRDGRIVTMGMRGSLPPAHSCGTVPSVSRPESDLGMTDFTFTVTPQRSGAPSSAPFVVEYRTIDGSAQGAPDCSTAKAADGGDYVATSGQLTFESGHPAPKTVTVKVCGDELAEKDEIFTLRLTGRENFEITSSGTIENDDGGGADDAPGGGIAGIGADKQSGNALPPHLAGLSGSPATAAAQAAARAFALLPALAPAATAAETAASQAGAQAQAGVQAQVPQFGVGVAADREKQRQVERAHVDGAGANLFASSRESGSLARTFAVVMGALILCVAMLTGRRRVGVALSAQKPDSRSEGENELLRVTLRRERAQR